MSTQKRPVKLALFDPRYFPRISDFRLLFFADVVIVLDTVPVRSVWHTTRTYKNEGKFDPINVATTPTITLQVPFKNVTNQTFENVVCQQNGWQSEHVHVLSENYKGHSHNLGPVMDTIARFPIRYNDGIRRMWNFLTDYIGITQRKKIIFLSDLQGKVRDSATRSDLTIALGKRFGATHIVYPRRGWIYRRAKISKSFIVMRDDIALPRYTNRYDADWSIIDAIAKLGQLGLTDYFTTVATKEGWRVI